MSAAATLEEARLVTGGIAVEQPSSYRTAGASAGFWVGVVVLGLILAATLVVKVAHVGHPDAIDLAHPLEAPAAGHPFGTDGLGRDIFLRTVYASWLDIQVGLVTTVVPLSIGMVLGLLSGFAGGWIDALLMRIMDALLAFPFIVLILAFVAIFGVGLTGVYVGLIITGVPAFARLTRGEMLVLREQQFMMAARTLGFSNRRIVFRHALPHLIRPNLVYVPSNVLANILAVAALSYLGLGVRPPQPEWGAIIGEGQQYLLNAWWVSTLPGIFVVGAGVAFSLIGEGLAERLRINAGGTA